MTDWIMGLGLGGYGWRVMPLLTQGTLEEKQGCGNVRDLRCRGSHPETPNGSSEGRSGDGSQRVGEIVGGTGRVLEEHWGECRHSWY